MREIKFRGKTEWGTWCYGGYTKINDEKSDIWEYSASEIPTCPSVTPCTVLANTVGQFTGLLDKTGKEIYEGDILQTEKFGKDDGQGHNFSGKENFSVVFEHGAYRIKRGVRKLLLVDGSCYEVVGNVHDAPELLNN